ncbi:TetR/AcrR family transcriptional regulator [Actinomadura macrotermitis]|uniref:HTH-type transcriptional regulator BetI n=1 Tax=Actinomadura macrotermitis TaxID=2585200 RepID=A0A7K0BRM8_9ACTN|nr:TetR/AcrR family transcriptional regulator [Actinomadura macrotermitis]MQY03542.1 HTH-type transcriptional regulator BetI [Actinomadura macrotermitis]
MAVDRRALLVDAAAELFTERPYDEVTTTEIARRAGVAYGLIAHHFANKRGLYLATIRAAAERLRAVHETAPAGGTPAARLHDALTRHIAHLEANAEGYLALMRSAQGSDAEVRAIIDDYRWQGALRVLRAAGVTEPVRPALRTAMRGWVGFLNEIVIDHLRHRELSRDALADLAAATLAAALRTAHALDPGIGIAPELIERL